MTRGQRRDWRAVVFAHTELSAGEKLALLALEGFADYPAGTNARPGEAGLCAVCNLKLRTVQNALSKGRRLQLIEQTGRANPKRGLAAVYRLLSTRILVRVEDGFNPHEDADRSDFNPQETAFQPAEKDISTRTTVRTTNPVTPIQNTEGGPSRPAEPELPDLTDSETGPPSQHQPANGKPIYHPRCPKHIHVEYPPDCGGCGAARKAAEELAVANQARADTERAAIRVAIAECEACDGYGRLDDLSDCPKHPNFRQARAS